MITVNGFNLGEGLWWEVVSSQAGNLVHLELRGAGTTRYNAYQQAIETIVSVTGLPFAEVLTRLWEGLQPLPENYWTQSYGRYWVPRKEVTGLQKEKP